MIKKIGRRFTVRFFMDSETGAVYEVQVGMRTTPDSVMVWFECDCEQYADEFWCDHADRASEDMGEDGSFSVALSPDIDDDFDFQGHIMNDDDAARLRETLLRFGIVEVI